MTVLDSCGSKLSTTFFLRFFIERVPVSHSTDV